MNLHTTKLICFIVASFCHLPCLCSGVSVDKNNSQTTKNGGKTIIYIGGFFTYDETVPVTAGMPVVAETAVDHINNLPYLLNDYELRLRWGFTKGTAAGALSVLHDLVFGGPTVLMAWGPFADQEGYVLNEIAATYNLVQCYTGLSFFELGDSRYPLTIQLAEDERAVDNVRLSLLNHMGWARVAIIFFDVESLRREVENMYRVFTEGGVTVLTVEAVQDVKDVPRKIENLKKHDARIIFMRMSLNQAAPFFCEVFKQGLYGAKYVWIVPKYYYGPWWRLKYSALSCTDEEILKVVEYSIGLGAPDAEKHIPNFNINGKPPSQEQKDYMKTRLAHPSRTVRVIDLYTYDTIVLIALLLNTSIHELNNMSPAKKLEDFTYEDKEMAEVILNSRAKASFNGATGQISFGKDGQRLFDQEFFVKQIQGDESVKIFITSRDSSGKTQLVQAGNATLKWRGQFKPVDGVSEIEMFDQIASLSKYVMFVLTSLCIGFALSLLFINNRYKERKVIRITCPPLNNVIIMGSLVHFLSVFFYGIDVADLGTLPMILLCHARVASTAIGTSMALGALLMKTYRIHMIFSRAITKLKRVKGLPDSRLISCVGFLVCIDVTVLMMWILIDTTYIVETELYRSLDQIQPKKEIFNVMLTRYCKSKNQFYFSSILYATKALLIVFGVFLAWETRRISVAQLNDSKYLAGSIYIVALTTILCIPALSVTGDNVNLSFIVLSVSVLFTNTVALYLIFVPKIWQLFKHDDSAVSISFMASESVHFKSTDSGISNIQRLRQDLKEKNQVLKHLLCKLNDQDFILGF